MKSIFLVISFFTASILFGQNPIKKYPIKAPFSIFHQRTMIFNSKFNEEKRIKEALVDTKTMTEKQLNTAFKYAQLSEYPEALNTIDKLLNINDAKAWNYKTFWIGSWTEFFPSIRNFRQMHLIWIPKEENLHMEAEYLPKTDDGFYMVVRSLDDDEVPFSPAPTVAVNNVVQKLSSKKIQPAEKLADMYNMIMPGYGHSMGGFYPELKNTYKLTDDEIDIISRSTSINGWPDSINRTNRRGLAYPKINDYNYVKLAEAVGEYGVNALFWVMPNQTFATGFQPKSELGYFFVAEINKKETKVILEKEDLAFLNSPWWFKNVSSTTWYDPSTLILGNSSGSIASSSSSSNNNNGFTTTTVNGITIATTKLDRWDYKSGVIILYYGENRIVRNCYLYTVKFKKDESEESVAAELKAKIAAYDPYMHFEFKEGYDCNSAQGYLLKKGVNKMSISSCR